MLLIENEENKIISGTYKDYNYHVGHNGRGVRLGYVVIPFGHPWYGKEYEELSFVKVHGGITGADKVKGEWWIGFDCGHNTDLPDPQLPITREMNPITEIINMMGETFETFESGVKKRTIKGTKFVIEECKKVIDQAILGERYAG